MESQIAEKLRLRYAPVALTWSDTRPEKATEFKEGKWGCVMWMMARAARGGTAVCGRKAFGCWGGGVGLGFGDAYKQFPGGEDGFCHFLSIGNDQWDKGRQMADKVKPHMTEDAFDHFMHGERYMKSPEQVKRFIRSLPITDIPARTYIRQQLGDHLMTFAVPLKMFHEMEDNVEGSFLERPVWEKLANEKPDGRAADSA